MNGNSSNGNKKMPKPEFLAELISVLHSIDQTLEYLLVLAVLSFFLKK